MLPLLILNLEKYTFVVCSVSLPHATSSKDIHPFSWACHTTAISTFVSKSNFTRLYSVVSCCSVIPSVKYLFRKLFIR